MKYRRLGGLDLKNGYTACEPLAEEEVRDGFSAAAYLRSTNVRLALHKDDWIRKTRCLRRMD
jgi:hypothetical protein